MANGESSGKSGGLAALLAGYPRTSVVACAGALLAAMILAALVGVPDGGGLPLWISRMWATGGTDVQGDSWDVMRAALAWLRANGDGAALYDDVFFTQNLKFQYAPTSLLTFELIEALGGNTSTAFLTEINRMAVGLTAAATAVFAWLVFQPSQTDAQDHDARLAQAGASVIAAVGVYAFYPVMYAFSVGQIQAWIALLFVLAAIAWKLDRRIVSGVLIGLACAIKPQLGLFLVWGLLRREWRFAAALAAAGTSVLAISIGFYGIGAHFAYLDVLSFISRHGESFWANQSVNGLLHRLFENGEIATWDANGFAPFHPVVYALTLLTSAALLAAFFMTRRNSGCSANDFLLAGLVFTMASPVAWEHHYGILAPMFMVVLASIAGASGPGRLASGVMLAIAFALTSTYFGGLAYLDQSPVNLLQSHVFFGAVIVLVLLWKRTGPIHMPTLRGVKLRRPA